MTTPNLFDKSAIKKHRLRAINDFHHYSFLYDEVEKRLFERLLDIKKTLQKGLYLTPFHKETTSLKDYISCENFYKASSIQTGTENLICDEEVFPFKDKSLDLILSHFHLHWINDVPGYLIQLQRSLKSEGMIMGSFLGGETLKDLKDCFQQAEIEEERGLRPRFSPLIDVKDIGALLQRAGFILPVTDCDRITVTYPSTLDLLKDLRGMAETNSIAKRHKKFTKKSTFLKAIDLHDKKYKLDNGQIKADFDIIYFHGWSPSTKSQKPLKPGSANLSIKDFL